MTHLQQKAAVFHSIRIAVVKFLLLVKLYTAGTRLTNPLRHFHAEHTIVGTFSREVENHLHLSDFAVLLPCEEEQKDNFLWVSFQQDF